MTGVQGPPGAAVDPQAAAWRQWLIQHGRLFEYRVEQVRQTLVGDKINTGELERLLNGFAQQGWAVKSITPAEVKGRVGPGGTSGLLVVFERPVMR